MSGSELLVLRYSYDASFESGCGPFKDEHASKLAEVQESGKLILACSFDDPKPGGEVLHFDGGKITREELEEWIAKDPYVVNKLIASHAISSSSLLGGAAKKSAPAATPSSGARVALVTGSSTGIGKAMAEGLALEGYRVVVNSYSSPDEGKAAAASLPGGQGLYLQSDCGKEDQCKALIENVVQQCGRLDVLICNHGINKVIPHKDLDLIDSDFLHKVFSVNLFGALWLSIAAMPHLKKSEDGNIIMTSSAAGSRPMGSSIPYSMTKAALNHLTKLLAKSHGPVRVNCVAPGLIKTRITSGEAWEKLHEACEAGLPLHRVGTPEDLIEVVLSILRSKYMTGQIIGVDGGATVAF